MLIEHSPSHLSVSSTGAELPVHAACAHGHVECVRLLLQSGLSPAAMDGSGRNALHAAATCADCEVMRVVIEGRTDLIDVPDVDGNTALHTASARGHVDAVSYLLSLKAAPSVANKDNETALHAAAEGGHTAVIDLLLSAAGVDFNPDNAWTPFHAAARAGHREVIEQFLACGGTVPSNPTCLGPLHVAVQRGHGPIVQLLLTRGVDPNMAGDDGIAPLHVAAEASSDQMVRLLLLRGANAHLTDARGWTPLHVAVAAGNLGVARFFLDNHVDPHSVGGVKGSGAENDGWPPILAAAHGGSVPAMQLLLDFGAKLDAKAGNSDTDALTVAIEAGHSKVVDFLLANHRYSPPALVAALHVAVRAGVVSVVEKLLTRGLDVNSVLPRNESRTTPLLAAVERGHTDVVMLLLSTGADVKCVDSQKMTALHYAALKGNLTLASVLLTRGVNARASTNDGRNALHFAAAEGHRTIVSLLLEHGVDANVADNRTKTPMFLAAAAGHGAVIETLFQRGGHLRRKGDDSSPLHVAAKNGHTEVVELLLRMGADRYARDTKGNTAEAIALAAGHTELAVLLKCEGAIASDTTPADAAPRAEVSPHSEGTRRLISFQALYRGYQVRKRLQAGLAKKPTGALVLARSTPSNQLGWTQLHAAAADGFAERVKTLLADGVDPHALTARGVSAVHAAAMENSITVLQVLQQAGCAMDSGDALGATPLMYAAAHGHTDALLSLLLHGASPVKRMKDGAFPLLLAVANAHYAAAEVLLSKDVKTDMQDTNGITPLLCAVQTQDSKMVKLLLQYGASVHITDSQGRSPLFIACSSGCAEALAALLAHGVDPNALGEDGCGCVMTAVRGGHTAVVAMLIDKLASFIRPDGTGWTAVHEAALRGRSLILHYMLRRGCDPNLKTKAGKAPIHVAVKAGHLPTVGVLLAANADIEIADEDGNTPLLLAIEQGDANAVKYLTNKGASVSVARPNDGFSPLHVAVSQGKEDIVAHLIKCKTDLNATDPHGRTPIFLAAACNHVNLLTLLWENKANPHATTHAGQTLLHAAAAAGHMEVASYLIHRRILVDIAGAGSRRPLHDAAEGGHLEMVELLLGRGASLYADVRRWNPVHFAAGGGHINTLRRLASEQVEINAVTLDGWNALTLATNANATEAVYYLLDTAKFDVNFAGHKKHYTALHLACLHGSMDIASLFVEKGCDLLAQSLEGRTPLHLAASEGQTALLQFLVSKNEQSQHVTDLHGNTPLHLAAVAGHEQAVDALLAVGSDVKKGNAEKRNALHLCTAHGRLNVLKLLLGHGLHTPLSSARRASLAREDANTSPRASPSLGTGEGDPKPIAASPSSTSTVDAPASTSATAAATPAALASSVVTGGETLPASDAASEVAGGDSLPGVVPSAVAGGAFNPSGAPSFVSSPVMRTEAEATAALAAVRPNVKGGLGLKGRVTRLMEPLIDVLSADASGMTALHIAAAEGHKDCLSHLLTVYPPGNPKDAKGYTALHYAAANGHVDCALILLSSNLLSCGKSCGPDCHAMACAAVWLMHDSTTSSVLNVAIEHSRVEVVQLLLTRMSEVNLVQDGVTPLQIACRVGPLSLVEMLVARGADPCLSDAKGNSALHCALVAGKADIAKFILTLDIPLDLGLTQNWSLIHAAASGGLSEALRSLLDQGADLRSAYACDGPSPLLCAATNGHTAIVSFLMSLSGWTPFMGIQALHAAVEGAYYETVTAILQKGIDPNVPLPDDKMQNTPVIKAGQAGHSQVVLALLSAGADHKKQNLKGWTALHSSSETGMTSVVSLLLTRGGDPNNTDEEGQLPLHRAAWKGHADVVALLSQNAIDINQQDDGQRSPLWLAASEGHFHVVSLLLKGGALPNTGSGVPVLNVAAAGGYTEIVKILHEHGARSDGTDREGCYPLHLAARGGHLVCAKFLVDVVRVSVDAVNDKGATACIEAADQGHHEVLKVLLEYNANVSHAMNNGDTALSCAAKRGHVKVVELLRDKVLNAGPRALTRPLMEACRFGHAPVADVLLKQCTKQGISLDTSVDENGMVPLMMASLSGHIDVVTLLLSHGVDPNIKTPQGQTALHCAASAGYMDVVELLLANKADPVLEDSNKMTPINTAVIGGHLNIYTLLKRHCAENQVNGDNSVLGWTVLHAACKGGSVETVKSLLEEGENTSVFTAEGYTPMHLAVMSGFLGCMELLHAKKADVNLYMPKTPTVLHTAIDQNNEEVFKWLLEKGASVTAVSDAHDRKTPLHFAILLKRHSMVSQLIDCGADVNTPDAEGTAPIHTAAANDDEEGMQLLLGSSCWVDAVNAQRRTALHIAASEARTTLMQLLLSSGASADVFDAKGDSPLKLALRSDAEPCVRLMLQNCCPTHKAIDRNYWSSLQWYCYRVADKESEIGKESPEEELEEFLNDTKFALHSALDITLVYRTMAKGNSARGDLYTELADTTEGYAIGLLSACRSSELAHSLLSWQVNDKVESCAFYCAVHGRHRDFIAMPLFQSYVDYFWHTDPTDLTSIRRQARNEPEEKKAGGVIVKMEQRLELHLRQAFVKEAQSSTAKTLVKRAYVGVVGGLLLFLMFPYYWLLAFVSTPKNYKSRIKSSVLGRAYIKFLISNSLYLVFVINVIMCCMIGTSTMVKEFHDQEILLYLWVCGFLLLELEQCIDVGLTRYFSDPWNIMDVITFFSFSTSFIIKMAAPEGSLVESTEADVTTALASCLVFQRLLNLCAIHPHLGPLLIMLKRMTTDIALFSYLLLVCYLGFGVALRFLEQTVEDDIGVVAPTTISEMLVRLVYSTYGAFDTIAEPTAYRMFQIVCLFYINIVLMNLLIAMMGNTYGVVLENADKEWRRQRLEMMMGLAEQPEMPVPFNLLFALPRMLWGSIYTVRTKLIARKKNMVKPLLSPTGEQTPMSPMSPMSPGGDRQSTVKSPIKAEQREEEKIVRMVVKKYIKQKISDNDDTEISRLERLEKQQQQLISMTSNLESSIATLGQKVAEMSAGGF